MKNEDGTFLAEVKVASVTSVALEFPEDMKCELEPWIPSYSVCVINLASQSEMTICQYQSDFKYIVRYLSCGNDRRKLDEYFQTTEFQLDHPEAFLDWLSAVTNDRRYRKAKELIETTEGQGGRINMCVLLDMYEERGRHFPGGSKGCICHKRSIGISGGYEM